METFKRGIITSNTVKYLAFQKEENIKFCTFQWFILALLPGQSLESVIRQMDDEHIEKKVKLLMATMGSLEKVMPNELLSI